MTITIIQESTTYDEWGNPTTTATETNYEIDSKDFQPISGVSRLSDTANISDEGILKHRFRMLFLKGSLKNISIDIGNKVRVNGQEYIVSEIQEYERHKEVICHAVE